MEPGRIFTCTPHTSNISIGVSFTLKGYNVQDLGPERDCHDQASWGGIYTLHGLPLSWRYWSTVFVKIMCTWLYNYLTHCILLLSQLPCLGHKQHLGLSASMIAELLQTKKSSGFTGVHKHLNAFNRSLCSDVGVSINNESLHDMQQRNIDSVHWIMIKIKHGMNADFQKSDLYGSIRHSQSLRGVESGGFLNDATHPGLVLLESLNHLPRMTLTSQGIANDCHTGQWNAPGITTAGEAPLTTSTRHCLGCQMLSMLSSHSGDRADRPDRKLANVCKCKLPTKVTAGFRHLRRIKDSTIKDSTTVYCVQNSPR